MWSIRDNLGLNPRSSDSFVSSLIARLYNLRHTLLSLCLLVNKMKTFRNLKISTYVLNRVHVGDVCLPLISLTLASVSLPQ